MPSMNELPANYKVYKNGAIFDTDKGRIVAVKPELAVKNTQITKENTGDMLAKRLDKKREAVIRGANAVVSEGGKYDGTDYDFVEAIAEVQTIKALNPDDPKSTDAARFVFQEAGLADKQAQVSPVEQMSDLLQALAAFAQSIHPLDGSDNSYYRKHEADIVDAETEDTGQAGEAEQGTDDGG